MDDLKTCKKCGEAKPRSEYYRHASTRDRLHPACKACMTAERRAWYEKNRAANLAYQKAWRSANPATKQASSRAWHEAHRDEHNERQRLYYAANHELWEERRRKREKRKASVEHQPYTRTQIYQRDGGQCRTCRKPLDNKPGGFHVDHIVPIVLGGPDTPANVQLMCGPCNRSKGARLEGQTHFAV